MLTNTGSDPVYEALKVWINLTEVDPLATTWGGDWGHFEICEANQEMRLSQDLDSTGLTTAMLLKAYANWYARTTQFSLEEMVADPAVYSKKIHQFEMVHTILAGQEPLIKTFQEKLLKAAEQYGYATKAIKELVADTDELAFIRRDALRAMQDLQTHQFLQGSEDPAAAPKYNKHLYEVWNVNSLIDLVIQHAESGVSLFVVRDNEEALYSFFVFAIRNGTVVTVMTDRPEFAHPEQRHMMRDRGRSDRFEKRAYRFRFPYEMIETKQDQKGVHRAVKRTALVKHQAQAVRLKELSDLKPDTALWIAMIFDLMVERFWRSSFRTRELAYTGEMLRVPKVLPAVVNDLAIAQGYQPISLARLDLDDVSTPRLIREKQWERKPTRCHEWMLQRYKDRVDESVLNVVGEDERKALPFEGLSKTDRRDLTTRIKAFDPTWFGTAAELDRDRKWIARYNLAKSVGTLAEEEYRKTKGAILGWFNQKVHANDAALIDHCARGSCRANGLVMNPENSFDEIDGPEEILRLEYRSWMMLRDAWLAGDRHDDEFDCYICRKRTANLWWTFSPRTADAIAMLAGVTRDDLPDVLRQWRKQEHYCGNSILDRLDPMDWAVENPWVQESFEVVIGTCIRCLKKIRTAKGYKGEPIWVQVIKDYEESRKKRENRYFY